MEINDLVSASVSNNEEETPMIVSHRSLYTSQDSRVQLLLHYYNKILT